MFLSVTGEAATDMTESRLEFWGLSLLGIGRVDLVRTVVGARLWLRFLENVCFGGCDCEAGRRTEAFLKVGLLGDSF
jgi:hypothetical protein